MHLIRLNAQNNSITLRNVSNTFKLLQTGRRGLSATIAVGETTTLPAGSDATVTNVGTSSVAVFDFGIPEGEAGSPATNLVQSVNGQQGVVVLDAGDVGADASGSASQALSDANDYTDTQIGGLATVASTGDYNDLTNKPTIPTVHVTSVNGKIGDVVLTTADINDTALRRYTNDTDITRLANTSGVNTGDQDLSGYATTTALTTGLATKEPLITAGTTAQYWRGDKSWQTLDKTAVGLANVDNTSDASKPISSATQTALNLKEDLANKSTTTTLGTSNTLYPTQNAVKTYVDTAITGVPLSNYVLKAGDTMTGTLTSTVSGGLSNVHTRGANTWQWGTTSGNSFGIWSNSASAYQLQVTPTGTALGASAPTPTHTLTLPSTATGIALYNTTDQTTNYERVRQYWSSNTFTVLSEVGGTGTRRSIQISSAGYLQVNANSSQGFVQSNGSSATASAIISRVDGTLSSTSGVQYGTSITPTINQSSTAGATIGLTNPTVTAQGSGVYLLHDFQVGGVSKLSIDFSGNVTHADGANFAFGTTTGTKIGTATTQKIGFFNATPVVQATATTDLGTVLSNLGFRAASTTYTLSTSGATAFVGSIRLGLTTRSTAVTLTITSVPYNFCDATSAPFTVTLPSTTTTGVIFTIKKTDATANAVTVKAGAAGTIDASNTFVLSALYDTVRVVSTSVSDVWYII